MTFRDRRNRMVGRQTLRNLQKEWRMDMREVQERLEAALEQLASIEHDRWAHWQRYMHSKAEWRPDGSMVICADLVAQWSRQIETPYEALSDEERESDREQVRRYLPAIVDALAMT